MDETSIFHKILEKYGLVLQKSQNQLGLKEAQGTFNNGGLCECHKQASINANWEKQQANMLWKTNTSSQICCKKSVPEWKFQHVGIGSMRFSFLSYAEEVATQFFYLWTMLHDILRHFKGRMLWCVYYYQCNELETAMRFGSYFSIKKKRYKFLLLKDVLLFYQLDNNNQQLLKEEIVNFVEDLLFAMADLQLC